MRDKDFALLGIVGIGIVIIVLAVKGPFGKATQQVSSQPAPVVPYSLESEGLPVAWNDPMDGVYNDSPDGTDAFAPPSLGDLTINVPNGSLASLSEQYLPLFGFVGVAQGEMYQ